MRYCGMCIMFDRFVYEWWGFPKKVRLEFPFGSRG